MMNKQPRKSLVCPVCGRPFVQSRRNQRYCGKGCAKTAYGVRRIISLTKACGDKIIGKELTE